MYNLGFFMFFVSVVSVITNSREVIKIIVSLEVMFLTIVFLFVLVGISMEDGLGLLFALIILTIGAAESAIGLGILVDFNELSGSVSMENLNLLQGW